MYYTYKEEYEWLEYKENWFSKDEIGEYISAIANSACLCGKEYGYIIWGISDSTKRVVGTTVNFDKNINHKPYKHYLTRNLQPNIPFEVTELDHDGYRVVLLIIPASKSRQKREMLSFNPFDRIKKIQRIHLLNVR